MRRHPQAITSTADEYSSSGQFSYDVMVESTVTSQAEIVPRAEFFAGRFETQRRRAIDNTAIAR